MLNEIERNLQDAMQVVRNVVFDPRMLPGGGATELAIAQAISKSVNDVEGKSQGQGYRDLLVCESCSSLSPFLSLNLIDVDVNCYCLLFSGISKWPYAAIGNALEVIPRTLAQNCGANVIRLMTDLRTRVRSDLWLQNPFILLTIEISA